MFAAPHGNEPAARREAATGFIEGFSQSRFVRQMFKEIARKDELEGIVLQLPSRRTVLLAKNHRLVQVARGLGIEVHRIFFCALDLVDEFPITATQIEHPVGRIYVALKKIRQQHRPNLAAVSLVLPETGFINFFEFKFGSLALIFSGDHCV